MSPLASAGQNIYLSSLTIIKEDVGRLLAELQNGANSTWTGESLTYPALYKDTNTVVHKANDPEVNTCIGKHDAIGRAKRIRRPLRLAPNTSSSVQLPMPSKRETSMAVCKTDDTDTKFVCGSSKLL